MNNPIMALIQAARGGSDPMQVIGQMAEIGRAHV